MKNPPPISLPRWMFRSWRWQGLQKGLPAMRRLLMSVGFGLYQIDYKKDFSGTMVRSALVQHLESVDGFFQQGQFTFPENGGCILDNTKTVGDHVYTFVQTRNGKTASTKSTTEPCASLRRGMCGNPLGARLKTQCRQHQQPSSPDSASSRCAKKGMHKGRSFTLRLRYGGSFPNCGGGADCGGFGAGEHRRGPVYCTAASKAMGKPSAAFGPVHAAGRPHTGDDIPRMERPQQNRQSAGGARQTDGGNGRRRRLLGESNAMDDGGLWIPEMSHISRGDCGRGRRRRALFASSLFHKRRTNHSCSEQQTVRAASRSTQPTRSAAAQDWGVSCLDKGADMIANGFCIVQNAPAILGGGELTLLEEPVHAL